MWNRPLRRCFTVLLATLGSLVGVVAQTTSLVVTGKVTESPSGQLLLGVSVVEINANDRQVNGVMTDAQGKYTLRVSDPKNRIRFSFIGSKTITEPINGRTVIDASLVSSDNQLEAVAITTKKVDAPNTGFMNTSRRDLIGSIGTLKGETFEKEPATSIDQMLQGRVSGVQVVSDSGDPGGGADIRIRGVATVTGNAQPLYIVDGIPIISSSDGSSDVARTNPIADLNPNDIERIDILKDANAGAIYGSRANNGVILVTTKRGRAGVTNITFTSKLGFSQAPKSIPVLDATEYKSMQLEALQNAGIINPLYEQVQPLLDDPNYESVRYYQNNTNWFQGLTQTGFTQNYGLSVGGGGESVKYNFSTSYTNEQGAMVKTGFQRFTGSFRLDYKVSDKLKFAANIGFTRSRRDQYWNLAGGGTPYEIALTRTPLLPIYDIDANGKPQSSYFSLPGIMNGQDNPIAFVETVSNYAYSTNLQPNVSADYQITKSLAFRTNIGINFVGDNGAAFVPPEATGVIWNDVLFNRLQNRDVERRLFNSDLFLTYRKQLTSKLNSSFLLGTNYTNNSSNNLTTESYATATGQMRSLGASAAYAYLRTNVADDTYVRLFTSGQVIYDDKYSVNFVLSRDGSSKFGPSHRYGLFPSFGAYWRVSGEPFLKESTVISDLKLRGTWGETGGNSIGTYAYISQFSTGRSYLDQIGVAQSNPQLNNLRWETSLQRNVGLDLELFKRANLQLDFYFKKTKNLLYNLTVPTSSGLANTSILVNLGDIANKGFDLDLSGDIIRAKNFTWNSLFNISRNLNKVTSLPGGTLTFTNNYARFQSQVKQGDPLGTYYGLVYKGVYATDADAVVRDAKGNIVYNVDGVTPRVMRVDSETGNPFKGGDAIYEDFNHDGVINAQDRVLIGNANPDFFGGFTNMFKYKQFSVNIFINYQYGNDVINGLRYTLERMDNVNNQASTVLRRWRKQGDQTDIPRALRNDNRNTIGSTRWIEDGSYLRLNSLTFGYQMPNVIARKLKLRKLDFYVTGKYLYTITGYSGADPEIPLGGDLAFGGVDRATTPRARQVIFGTTIQF